MGDAQSTSVYVTVPAVGAWVPVLAGLERDLAAACGWLVENAAALSEAGVVSVPRVDVPYYSLEDPPLLRIGLYCRDRAALARVARVLVRGVGKGGVIKQVDTAAELVRRFGQVSVVAWTPREQVCVPLTGAQTGWDCSRLFTEPLLTEVVSGDG